MEKFLPAAGGVGTYLRTLADLQRRHGHQVLRFGCATAAGSRLQSRLQSRCNGIGDLSRCNGIGDLPHGMPPFVDFTATRNPLALLRMVYNPAAAAALDGMLRRRGVDVAHLHNIYHHLTPSILPVLARRGVPVVMTVHDCRFSCGTHLFLRSDGACTRCHPNRFYHAVSPRCCGLRGLGLAVESYFQRLWRPYFRHVGRFICPSRFMRDLVIAAGVPRHKAAVVYAPLPPIGPPGAARQQSREVLFAGQLRPEKGADLMLDLAALLARADVIIAGDGPEAPALHRRAAREDLANVRFVGHLDRPGLARQMARSAVVVVPSRCMENSPLAMLEAMAAGRCVVVPDQPPLKEWVADGRTGRLFPIGDAQALARVVAEALDDGRGRAEMAAAAKRLVAARHAPQAVYHAVQAQYEEAVRTCESR